MHRQIYLITAGLIFTAMIGLGGCEPGPVVDAGAEAPSEVNTAKTPVYKSPKVPERRYASTPESGVELGMGWDSRRGEIVPNHCIDFAPIRATGQDIEVELSEVADQSELMESLNVSANVAVKTIIASGSAKGSFAKKSKVTSNSTTLLLYATVENGVIFVGPSAPPAPVRSAYPAAAQANAGAGRSASVPGGRLSDEISFKSSLRSKTSSPDAFRDRCGDYFVSAIYSGAELMATIEFASKSKTESKAIKTAVKASYGAVSAGGETATNNSAVMNNTNFNMKFAQTGGGVGMIPISKEGLQQKLQKLAIEAYENPKFHTMELRSYREVPGGNGLVYNSMDEPFEVISDYYWLLSSVYDEIEDIRLNPASYDNSSGLSSDELLELQDEILEVRAALYEIMDAYIEGRRPEREILDKVDHQWFPGDAAKAFVLDLTPIAALRAPGAETDPASVSECDSAAWFACLVKELTTAFPYENPNTVRLLLPLPKHQLPEAEPAPDFDRNKAILDWYVGRQSKRVCQRDPTDNECLTNQEIADLMQYIP